MGRKGAAEGKLLPETRGFMGVMNTYALLGTRVCGVKLHHPTDIDVYTYKYIFVMLSNPSVPRDEYVGSERLTHPHPSNRYLTHCGIANWIHGPASRRLSAYPLSYSFPHDICNDGKQDVALGDEKLVYQHSQTTTSTSLNSPLVLRVLLGWTTRARRR